MTDRAEGIARRLASIEQSIEEACRRSGRRSSEITIVAASKSQSAEVLRAAWQAGVRVFGENRVLEALEKSATLPPELEWHLIGPLQSNKVKRALDLFRTIHSVDRLKIGRMLDREAASRGIRVQGFIEVNLGGEESKHGFAPNDLAAAARPLADLEALEIVGLMAVPPFSEDAEASRPWFRRLRELRDALCTRPEWASLPGLLSMGMSNDFHVAVEEGATHVRIGTALLGPRPG